MINHYTFSELEIGHKEKFYANITQEKMNSFRMITNDTNPLHNDLNYADSVGYSEKVVFGMMTASFLSTLCGVYLPGERSLIHSVDVKFIKAVLVSDSPLEVKGEVIEKNELFDQLVLKVEIRNNKDEKVLRGKMKVGVLK